MILDASALSAILRSEPDAPRMAHAIAAVTQRCLSAATFVEVAAVIDGSRDPVASRRYDDLLREAHITIEPVTEQQARLTRQAYRDYGKGSGHPAQLNVGDCFAYALAKDTGANRSCIRAPISATPMLRLPWSQRYRRSYRLGSVTPGRLLPALPAPGLSVRRGGRRWPRPAGGFGAPLPSPRCGHAAARRRGGGAPRRRDTASGA